MHAVRCFNKYSQRLTKSDAVGLREYINTGRREKLVPAGTTTAMVIRIFGSKDRELYGDIVHCHLKRPVPYQGAAELVLKIDAISRSLNLPPSGDRFRSMGRSRGRTGNTVPEEFFTVSDQDPGPAGKVQDTIDLQLVGRQHTSIQGRIWGRLTRKKY